MESLCRRAVWLERGRVQEIGDVSRVVQNYLQSVSSARTEQRWDDREKAPGNDIVRLRRTCVRPAEGPAESSIKVQDDFLVEVDYWNLQPGRKITVTFHLTNSHGIFVLETGSALADSGGEGRPLPRGLFRATCHVPGPLLNNGGYTIHLFFVEDGRTVAFMHRDALQFEVLDSMEGRGVWLGTVQGVVRPRFRWTNESLESEAEEEADTKHSLAPPPGSVT
jgi:lipopolysaccharide transport system ATP-binding protein